MTTAHDQAPIEPEPSRWGFPDPRTADRDGVVGSGADLEPGTVLAAYRIGMFPMPVNRGRTLTWWSPDPRGILPLDNVRVSRSLRRSVSNYEIRVDTAFDKVVSACADPNREGAWINDDIRAAYARLHELGWAHSVEAWHIDGELAGGLYGIHVGGLFAGESMFQYARDASKVALVALVELCRAAEVGLLDVQWSTPHLASLGVIDIPRGEYLDRLGAVMQRPTLDVWHRPVPAAENG